MTEVGENLFPVSIAVMPVLATAVSLYKMYICRAYRETRIFVVK